MKSNRNAVIQSDSVQRPMQKEKNIERKSDTLDDFSEW